MSFGWGAVAEIGGKLLDTGTNIWMSENMKDFQEDALNANIAMQRDFAKQGIRWRVEDAQAAGIHPLYALGAQVNAASPVPVGDIGVGNASNFAGMGQDISRAIDSTRTANERSIARYNAAQAEGQELDNQMKRVQLSKLSANQVGPALPGYGPSDGLGLGVPTPVEVKPLELNASDPGNPAKEAGYVTDYGFARTPTGMVVVPSKDVKDRIEDQFVPETMWAIRNNLLPNLGHGRKPDPEVFDSFDGRPVVDWKWSYSKQEWQPVYFSDTWRRIEGR